MDKMIPLKVIGSNGSDESDQSASAGFGKSEELKGSGELGSASRLAAEARSPTGGKKHVELSRIHDFASKLCQPDVLTRVKEYVRWQAALRGTAPAADHAVGLNGHANDGQRSRSDKENGLTPPDFAPVSINLDITTACNYACDHCVDMDILNQPIKYDHQKLLDSLELMANKGLRSVIVIGGGEPTVYPKFGDTIRFMKGLGLQVSIVSNGSGMKKIAEVADCLEETDWIRLSLDSGSDEVFQAMHKPKRKITLDEICEGVSEVKCVSTRFKIGFSFIITWKGAFINDTKIVENIDEIVMGAERARKYSFDYISYKPFLTRAPENNAEVVDLHDTDAHFDTIIARIRKSVDEAKKLATDTFDVYEATNLKVLENRSYKNYTEQPHRCHMQFFRQVLSPLGMYNCPVYRNQRGGYLGTKEAYTDPATYDSTRRQAAELVRTFDANHECKEVTCLYNHVNWWLEGLIDKPELLDELQPSEHSEPDYFL